MNKIKNNEILIEIKNNKGWFYGYTMILKSWLEQVIYKIKLFTKIIDIRTVLTKQNSIKN